MTFIDNLKKNKVFISIVCLVGLIAMGIGIYVMVEGFKLFEVVAGVFTPLMWLIGVVMVSSGIGIIVFVPILLLPLIKMLSNFSTSNEN
ncbi:hypothetical protein AAD001_01335 [Colwelliaceae bacterium 6471]